MTRNADHRRGHGHLAAGALALALAGAGVSGEARAADPTFCTTYAGHVATFMQITQELGCPPQGTNEIRDYGTAFTWCLQHDAGLVQADLNARSAAAQTCGAAGATGTTPPAPATGGATATVNGDVDLYNVPGGTGNVIGMLMQGQTIGLTTCRGDNWCQVTGWVWGDFLNR